MAPGTRILLTARAQREAPGPRRAGFPGTSKEIALRVRTGLHTAEPYFHEDSSTALESAGRHASALRCCKCRWTAARFVADFRPRPSARDTPIEE